MKYPSTQLELTISRSGTFVTVGVIVGVAVRVRVNVGMIETSGIESLDRRVGPYTVIPIRPFEQPARIAAIKKKAMDE
jgi:hypothetical protein